VKNTSWGPGGLPTNPPPRLKVTASKSEMVLVIELLRLCKHGFIKLGLSSCRRGDKTITRCYVDAPSATTLSRLGQAAHQLRITMNARQHTLITHQRVSSFSGLGPDQHLSRFFRVNQAATFFGTSSACFHSQGETHCSLITLSLSPHIHLPQPD